MKRILIICEGPTEVEFCKDVLVPHFLARNIHIQTPLIKKSGGGIVHWGTLHKQIQTHLQQDASCRVTTLIDYYGIHEKHQFPNWKLAHTKVDKNERMCLLEQGMKLTFEDTHRHRFVPYIQLHEFEGLLFNTIDVFVQLLTAEEFLDKPALVQTLENYPNPELINDTPENAPSYRLERYIKGYKKIVYGAILAQTIGLNRIRSKSPRFNQWITTLEGENA